MQLEQEKQQYLIHSKLNSYKQHIKKAKETITSALPQAKKWIMSFSGGKDSIVMLDLAVKSGFNGELLYFYYSEFENPQENEDLVKYYAEKYNLKLNVLNVLSCKDAWDKLGYFFCTPSTQEEKEIAKSIDKDYRAKSTQFCKDNGFDGLFMGIRKDESNLRKMSLSQTGDTYFAKCRNMITCCPNANFTDDDVWSYIFTNDLKYLSVYDNPYFDRRRTRNELVFMSARRAVNHGLLTNYNLLYPEIISDLKERYGNLPEIL